MDSIYKVVGMFGKRHKRQSVKRPDLIDTGQARALIAKENRDNLTRTEAAKLEVWRFYRRPTKRYQFILKRPYHYAYSIYGDRLGRIENFGGKGLHIHGDNGINYYGLKSDIHFGDMSINTVANFRQWGIIEYRKNYT